MTIQEAYLRSLQKNEQNLANGGIKLDPGRFVLLFNEAQDRLVKYYLNRKDDETIRSIQNLLVYWMSLDNAGRMDDPESTSFNLPDDYLWFSNIKGVFSYKGCEVTDFVMWEAKNENIHELLGDENNRPSYDYRETFYSIGNGKVVVYESGFRTEEVKMTYYRRPVRVDLSGYINAAGIQSTDIDPELPDYLVEEILDRMEEHDMGARGAAAMLETLIGTAEYDMFANGYKNLHLHKGMFFREEPVFDEQKGKSRDK